MEVQMSLIKKNEPSAMISTPPQKAQTQKASGADAESNNASISHKTHEYQENIKRRIWRFLVYPESAPADWIDFLKNKGICCAISPLHDRDIWDKDVIDNGVVIHHRGDLKKAHYHILAVYRGPTSFTSIKDITDTLGQPRPDVSSTFDPLKAYEYLWHKNDPDKTLYDENGVVLLNDFNPEALKGQAYVDNDMFNELEDLLIEQNALTFTKALQIVKDNGDVDMVIFFRRHGFHFDKIIKGIWQDNQNLKNPAAASFETEVLKILQSRQGQELMQNISGRTLQNAMLSQMNAQRAQTEEEERLQKLATAMESAGEYLDTKAISETEKISDYTKKENIKNQRDFKNDIDSDNSDLDIY